MILAGVAGINTFLSTQRQPTLRMYTIPVLLRISTIQAGVVEINAFSSIQTTNIESAYCTCSPGDFHDIGRYGRNKHLIYIETTNTESRVYTVPVLLRISMIPAGVAGINTLSTQRQPTLRVYTVPVLLRISMILAGVAEINIFLSTQRQPTLRVYTVPVLLRISMILAGVPGINTLIFYIQTANVGSVYCTCSPGDFHDTSRCGGNKCLLIQRQPTLRVHTVPVLLRISMIPEGVVGINAFSSTQRISVIPAGVAGINTFLSTQR